MLSLNGQNYKSIEVQILSGIFFFLQNEVIIYDRQLYSYGMFLGQMGGIMGLIISILKFIVEPIRFNFDLARVIQIIYFKTKNKTSSQSINEGSNQQSDNLVSSYHTQYLKSKSTKCHLQFNHNKCYQHYNQEQTMNQNYKKQQDYETNINCTNNHQLQLSSVNNINHSSFKIFDPIQPSKQHQVDQNKSTRNQPKLDLDLQNNNYSQKKVSDGKHAKQIRQSVANLKKLTQIKTKKPNLEKLHELEFTVLDILNDVTFIKPIFLFLKKTRLARNYKTYNILKQDLLQKLQIQKIVGQMIKQRVMGKQIETINQELEVLKEIQYLDGDGYIVDNQKQCIDEIDSMIVSKQIYESIGESLCLDSENMKIELKDNNDLQNDDSYSVSRDISIKSKLRFKYSTIKSNKSKFNRQI